MNRGSRALALTVTFAMSAACASSVTLRGASGPAPADDEVPKLTQDRQDVGEAAINEGTAGSPDSDGEPATPSRPASSRTPTAAGRCRERLKIGVSYSSDTASAIAGVGADPTTYTNYVNSVRQLYQLGIDDLNRRGGLGGCPVELSLYDFRATASDGFSAESQRECAYFGDDQRVFAVVPTSSEQEVLITCLAKRNIPVFIGASPTEGLWLFAMREVFAEYRGTLYGLSSIAVDRLGPVIGLLHRGRFFDRGARVGILMMDVGRGTNQRLVNDIWKPRLAQLGVAVASVFTYTFGDSVAAAADVANQMNSAVLQFRRAGVTHVLSAPGPGYILFTQAANTQGYHPRLGLTTYNQPAAHGDVPPASARGALAVMWSFGDLVNQPSRAPTAPSSARQKCVELYKDTSAVMLMLRWCDVLNLLRVALADGDGEPSAGDLLTAVEGMAETFEIANGFGRTHLGPGRYDAAVQAQVMAWNSDQKAWQPASEVETIP